ncbi:hypothetical protein ABMA27_001051 [Loxostege sticticalis]|uniref:MULE transposase domain-containing protein n=1 Tax=Loxostege sticticalis TaxID=481309 RepID=A0ABR3I1C4_LOXSC
MMGESSSSSMIDYEYIHKQNSKILVRAGHQYCLKKKYKNGADIWECAKRKKEKCNGSITIQNTNIITEKPHKCTPDFEKNEIALKIQQLKNIVSTPDLPNVPTAYNSAAASYNDSGFQLSGSQFPLFKNIKSTLYNHRNTTAQVKKIEFRNLAEVTVPLKFKSFLIADFNDNNTRILIFGTENSRNHMKTLKHFFGDGTFKSCCFPFYQLYTIHGDHGSTNDQTHIVPLLYVLMSDKTQKSYNIVFSMIKSIIPMWEPQTFRCDFEKATINAIQEIFPQVTVKGCFFHYKKAIWKKGRELNLTKSIILKRQIELAAVLPLLPENLIMEGWFYVASQSPDTENSDRFRQYVISQWIKEDFIKVVCVYGERHRTTNFLEGWHHKLNAAISKKKTKFTETSAFFA